MKKEFLIGRSFGMLAALACILLAGCNNGTEAQKPASPQASNADEDETGGPSTASSTSTDAGAQADDSEPLQLTSAQGEDAPEGNWGSLRGRFLYDGTAPKPEAIVPTKDVEFCGQHNLVDQSLVVNEEGQLANVFVFVYVPRGQKLEVHESYEETAEEPVVLDNNHCAFEPHCLVMRTSQPLSVKNSDPVGHNTNVPNQFNLIVPSGNALEHTFQTAQTYPLPVACNIHPWMKSHLLIREDPYATLSGGDGTFEIKNIPAGEHEFVFWHERPGNLGNLAAGKVKTDRRGRMKINIPAGMVVDLGDIEIPADSLKERY